MPEYRRSEVTITHWLPIVTFCPVNGLPDLLYVRVTFREFKELYAVRKALRAALQWKRMFMEDAAQHVSNLYPEAKSVEVYLMFNKHRITLEQW